MADRYVVMYSDGYSKNISENKGWFRILDEIYLEISTGSAPNRASAEKLFRNGKLIVEKNLSSIAWEYVRKQAAAMEKAILDIKEKYPEPDCE